MSFESMIAMRYVRARRQNSFISFISLVSIVGIALGVAALIIVLSVMNGFQKEIRTRMLGVASHLEVSSVTGQLNDWPAVQKLVAADPRVEASAPFIAAQGLLSAQGAVRGALVRGVVPKLEDQVVNVGSHMVVGKLTDLQPGGFGIVLGVELARALGVGMGDKVNLITPEGQFTPAGMLPRLKTFTVVGVFKVDMYEYDATLAMIDLADAQRLFRMGDSVSGLRLKLDDVLQAPVVKRDLYPRITQNLVLTDWTDQHSNYFRAVQIEKAHDDHHPDADRGSGSIQPGVDTGDGGDGQAGRHRHPAYAGSKPRLDHEDLHAPGRDFRCGRHRIRRGRRRSRCLQSRHHRTGHRTDHRHQTALQRGLHDRPPSERRAVCRRFDHCRHRPGAGLHRHALSELARRPHPTGRGIAL
ncbi:LolC [Laribacter hongkongensis HLHK9]|uniref:LolC n=1 Tax=Laribacter hongkongensis (strain HLHK9) TaxID=557598 RepID=C1D8M2_LARHH|nr:LolC [Laribacter hongkongensis HLHK9]